MGYGNIAARLPAVLLCKPTWLRNVLKIKKVADANTVRLQVLFLLVVIGTVLGTFILVSLHHVLFKLTAIDPLLLLPQHRLGLRPEPIERFVFAVLAFIVPIIAYWATVISIKDSATVPAVFSGPITGCLPVIIALMFFIPFIGFDFSQALVSGKSMPPEHPLRFLAACLIVSSIWYGLVPQVVYRKIWANRAMHVLPWLVFIGSMLLQTSAWRVLGEGSINYGGSWWNSIDAVVYSIGQVAGGATVLADLPTQYGLYAEFIGPIFKVFEFSVLRLSLFFAFLQVVSLTAVFYVAQKLVRDPIVKIAFGVALVMITFETSLWLIGIKQPYFQYWPIRFFWPAMSVLAFYVYSNCHTLGRVSVVSLIGAIGSLWNPDSGLMIEVAFAAFLVGKWTVLHVKHRKSSSDARKHLVHALLLHVLIFFVVVAVMFAYMAAKADAAIHGSWLFAYQQLFFGLGFMMLPMPLRPSPWMSILGVYLIGMLVAVAVWMRSPAAKQADFIFFLSFLGLGLFVYYEGRSHILNLISVCWPSLLLSVILADRVVRFVRAGKAPRINLCPPVVALTLIFFCCIPFVRNIGKLWSDASSNYATRNISSDPLVSDELTFIRTHSIRGEDCLILAKRQGLYYALTGTVSPVSGPGYAELLTVRDRTALIRQLSNKKFECIFVGVGPNSEFELGTNPLAILRDYSVQATSSMGSMLYLRPNAKSAK